MPQSSVSGRGSTPAARSVSLLLQQLVGVDVAHDARRHAHEHLARRRVPGDDGAGGDEGLRADLDARTEHDAAADARAAADRRPLHEGVALLRTAHEVVVRGVHAGRDEDVVLDRHVGGEVRAGLDLRVVADRGVVLDHAAAPDDDPLAQRAALPHTGMVAEDAAGAERRAPIDDGGGADHATGAEHERRDELWRVVSMVLTVATLVLLAVVAVVELAAPQVAWLVGALNFTEPELSAVSIRLIRLTTPAVLFLGIASILTGALYALKRFTIPAFIGAAFFSQYPEESAKVLRCMNQGEDAVIHAERKIFGFTHAQLGAELLKQWKLPPNIWKIVEYQLDPMRDAEYQYDASALCAAINIANYIQPCTNQRINLEESIPDRALKTWSYLGLSVEIIESVITVAKLQVIEVFNAIR